MTQKYTRLIVGLFLSQYSIFVIGDGGPVGEAGLVADQNAACYKHYEDDIPSPITKPKDNTIKIDVSDVIILERLGKNEDTAQLVVNGIKSNENKLKLDVGRSMVDFLVMGEGEVHAWSYGIKINGELVFQHDFSGGRSFFCEDEIYRYRLIFSVSNQALDKATEDFNIKLEKSRRGDPMAQAAIGKIYLEGTGVEKNAQQAVFWFTKAAEHENVYSQSMLGHVFSQNPAVYPAVKPDIDLAIYWYTKAAEQGSYAAQHNLAKILATRGDIDRAIPLYLQATKSSESSHHWATWEMLEQIFSVGYNRMKPEDGEPVVEWWIARAEQGDAEAQHIMGILFTRYPGSITRDYQKSLYWHTLAANQGYAPAQNTLGFVYLEGLGVPHDETKAMEWWRKAAEIDYQPSQHNLGLMYLAGIGTEKNLQEAYYWLNRAGSRYTNTAYQMLCQKDWVPECDSPTSREWPRELHR